MDLQRIYQTICLGGMKLKKGIKPEKIRNDEGKNIHQQKSKSKPKISMYVTLSIVMHINNLFVFRLKSSK